MSFKDITTGLDRETHTRLRHETTEQVSKLFEIDSDVWREVSFGLPQRYRETLALRRRSDPVTSPL